MAKTAKYLHLKENKEEVFEDFNEGMAFRVVARKYGVSSGMLHRFLNEPDNQNEYMAILSDSAESYASKAEEVLLDAPADKWELQRARELAHHYRWMAKTRNPRRFGEKVDLTSEGQKITPGVVSVNIIKPNEEED